MGFTVQTQRRFRDCAQVKYWISWFWETGIHSKNCSGTNAMEVLMAFPVLYLKAQFWRFEVPWLQLNAPFVDTFHYLDIYFVWFWGLLTCTPRWRGRDRAWRRSRAFPACCRWNRHRGWSPEFYLNLGREVLIIKVAKPPLNSQNASMHHNFIIPIFL